MLETLGVDTRSRWQVLATAIFIAMSSKSVMAGAEFAAWSVGLSAATLPAVLLGAALRLDPVQRRALTAAAAVLAIALFPPALYLGLREWASTMVLGAILSLGGLFTMAQHYRGISVGAALSFAVTLAAGLNLAWFT